MRLKSIEMVDGSLMLALVLSTTTSWRIGASPVSIGEVFGAFYIGKVFHQHSRGMHRHSPLEVTLIVFSFVIIPLIGTSYRALLGTPGFNSEVDLADGFRNFFAMLYVALLCSAQLFDARTRLQVVWRTIVFSIGVTVVLHITSVPLWWFGVVPTIWHIGQIDSRTVTDFLSGDLLRFVGFALNPNQLGMFIVGAFFVLMSKRVDLTLALRTLLLIGIGLVGVLIRSNTVFLAWVIGFGILAFNRINRGAAILLLVFILGIVTYIEFGGHIPISALVDKGPDSDANGRFPLWVSAIDAIAYSPIWGYGFGTHSGEAGPFQAMEAHNAFLDLSLQGGLSSGLLLLVLFHRSLRAAIRLGDGPLIAAVVACFVEQLSHNVLRTPFFWTIALTPLLMVKCQPFLEPKSQR